MRRKEPHNLRTIYRSTAVTAIKAGIFNCLKNFSRLEQIKKQLKKPALPAVSVVNFHGDEGN
jgi:hypothetical protein